MVTKAEMAKKTVNITANYSFFMIWCGNFARLYVKFICFDFIHSYVTHEQTLYNIQKINDVHQHNRIISQY